MGPLSAALLAGIYQLPEQKQERFCMFQTFQSHDVFHDSMHCSLKTQLQQCLMNIPSGGNLKLFDIFRTQIAVGNLKSSESSQRIFKSLSHLSDSCLYYTYRSCYIYYDEN